MVMTLCGENSAERLQEQKKAIGTFVADYTDMGLEQFDAEEVSYDRMLDSVQSVPFLTSRKLIVIHSGSLNKDFTEKFENFLGAINDSTDVLLIEGKLDKRTAFYKQLQKLTEFHEYKELDATNLARWAVSYTRENHAKITESDARYLISRIGDATHVDKRTGADQQLLKNELNKLMSYSPEISKTSITLLTDAAPQSKIFDLLESAFNSEIVRTLDLYKDQRAQGVEPQQIVSMLVWQLYILVVVKAGQSQSASEIAASSKMNQFVVEKTQRLVRQISLARLKQMISGLRELDVSSKRASLDLDDALQEYFLEISADR